MPNVFTSLVLFTTEKFYFLPLSVQRYTNSNFFGTSSLPPPPTHIKISTMLIVCTSLLQSNFRLFCFRCRDIPIWILLWPFHWPLQPPHINVSNMPIFCTMFVSVSTQRFSFVQLLVTVYLKKFLRDHFTVPLSSIPQTQISNMPNVCSTFVRVSSIRLYCFQCRGILNSFWEPFYSPHHPRTLKF